MPVPGRTASKMPRNTYFHLLGVTISRRTCWVTDGLCQCKQLI